MRNSLGLMDYSGRPGLTQDKGKMLAAARYRQWLSLCRIAGYAALTMALAACASPATNVVLNSDRIKEEFGSYGVEVLRGSARQRISSLHSTTEGRKITRTFAVVDFNTPMPATVAAEHDRITSGQSIGEVFRSAGWQIDKQPVFIGELEVSDTHAEIAALMHLDLPQTLATHVYLLVVTRDQRKLTYATITEIHHPDYLTAAELGQIYGEILFDDSGRSSIDDFVDLPDPY